MSQASCTMGFKRKINITQASYRYYVVMPISAKEDLAEDAAGLYY